MSGLQARLGGSHFPSHAPPHQARYSPDFLDNHSEWDEWGHCEWDEWGYCEWDEWGHCEWDEWDAVSGMSGSL